MILKDIFLYPDLVEFSARKGELLRIRDQTRHIGNYLGRQLTRLKFHADGFNRICVIGKSTPIATYLNSSAALTVYIPFNIEECLKVPHDELSDYYATLFKIGLNKCASDYSIPIAELISWLGEMKRGGYRNNWTFKERSFKALGVKAKLECTLSLDQFTLRLTVYVKNAIVFDEIILTTPPDENAFHYKFKDIEVEGGDIIVTTRLGGDPERVLFRTPIPHR